MKACVLPILQYPPYPLNTLSNKSVLVLQKVQNKALRFAMEEKYPYTRNTEELHNQARLEALECYITRNGFTHKGSIIGSDKRQDLRGSHKRC